MFVDLGEARADRSESSGAVSRPGGTNAALCLMATALMGSSIVGWRLISVWEKQHAEVQNSQRHFNQELVQAVHSLAENAGVLTSADLSPVKFRLRSVASSSSVPPTRPVSAELLKASESGAFQSPTSIMSRASGLLDFGLQEPGEYQLRVRMSDGMSTLHDFEVLPGVPVDRLVRFPGGCPNGEAYSIGLEWPHDLAGARIAAICRIAPCEAELEGWKWSPPPGEPGEVSWCQNCELRPGDAAVAEIVPCETIPMLGATTARAPLYYRHWELAEIVFVRLSDSDESSECVVLGRAQFGDGVDDAASLVGHVEYCPVWRVSGERPRLEAEGRYDWKLPLPPEIVKHLRSAIDWTGTTADRVDPSWENRRRQYFNLSDRHSRWSIDSLACWNPEAEGR